MPEEKFGIENVKKIIAYGMEYAEDIRKVKEDGQFKAREVVYFIDNVIKLPGILKSIDEFVDEALDISDAENQELRNWFMAEYGVVEDKVDALMRIALKSAVSYAHSVENTLELVGAIKALKESGDIV